MSWITVGVAAGGAFLGARNAQRRADQKEQYNKAMAESNRYSPWTGMKSQLDTSYTPDALEGGLQGGMQGLAMGQAANSAFGAASAAPAASGGMQSYAGANSLGGQDMAAQMGLSYGQPGMQFPELKPSLYGSR